MHPLFPDLDQHVDDHVTKHQVAQCHVTYFFSSFLSSEKAHPLTGYTLTKFSRWDSKATWLTYFSVPLTRGRFAGSQRHLAGHSDRFRVLPWCLPWMLEGGIKIPPSFWSFSPESTKQLSGTSLRLFAMLCWHCLCVCKWERYLFLCLCHLSIPGYSLLSWRVKRVQAGGTWRRWSFCLHRLRRFCLHFWLFAIFFFIFLLSSPQLGNNHYRHAFCLQQDRM